MSLDTELDIPSFQEKVGRRDFINTFTVKGSIIIHYGQQHFLWCNKSISSYPYEDLAGKLILKGDTWQDRYDTAPLVVYAKALPEQTRKKLGVTLPEGAANKIRYSILKSIQPVGDYFTAIPAWMLTKKNSSSQLYCDISSVFNSELELEEVFDILKLPTQGDKLNTLKQGLSLLSQWSISSLTSFDDLITGNHEPFGLGDDVKVHDLLHELYGIKTVNINLTDGTYTKKLSTHPHLAFYLRKEDLHEYLRTENNPYIQRKVVDIKPFNI